MAEVLVTGSNGFIGSHLVRALLEKGHEVRCLVRHTSDTSSLRGLPVVLFIGDVREPETLVAPVKNVEYVYHLAAELMVTRREAFNESIVTGTQNMLEVTRDHSADFLNRFLYVSSQAAAGPGDNQEPFDEAVPPKPISWYGAAKKRAEQLVQSYGETIPVTIVRPSAVYGPSERDISQVYPLVEKRLQPQLGLLKKYLVMVHVEDLIRGFINAAESENTLNQIYFLNHPEVLTTKQMMKQMGQAFDKSPGLRFLVSLILIRMAAPFAELVYHFTRNRPGLTRDKAREVSRRFWVNDPSKAKRDFNWEAHLNLYDGMKKTIGSFRHHWKELRRMPLENGFILWVKYVLTALFTGSILEAISAGAGFYSFDPWWGVFIIAVFAFGIGLGSLAMVSRTWSDLLQFFLGTFLAFLMELLNALEKLPFLSWEFESNIWLFSITNIWWRSLVLGVFGGIFVLIVNALLRSMYKRRLRLG